MDKKGYTLAELKKKYAEMSKKKGYRGWCESTKKNAGNVPLNNAIFNMMMGSSKSVDMAQVNADNFIGDSPSAPAADAPAVATPDGGVGMVGMAEDINNEPLTLKVTFDDGDYLVTKYEGTLNKAKDHFVGNSMKWENEEDEKKGVDVKLLPTNALPRGKVMQIQEGMSIDNITSVIRSLGRLSKLTADGWVALKDSPVLNKVRDDLWIYGNEVRALMAYVFEDEPSYDTAEMVYNKYAPRIGVSVDRVLKELKKREYDEWKANADTKSKETETRLKEKDPFNPLDEGFNGDEHALIERISNLKEGEVLELKNSHNDISLEEPLTMCIKKNPKFPGRYILWDETESGEKLNVVNFSSLDNAVEWAKQTDEFLTESKKRK